jgi:hypothetical protein
VNQLELATMLQDDASYYRHRAAVETERAEKARHPQAVAAHFQLATMYFDRVEGRDPDKSISRG